MATVNNWKIAFLVSIKLAAKSEHTQSEIGKTVESPQNINSVHAFCHVFGLFERVFRVQHKTRNTNVVQTKRLELILTHEHMNMECTHERIVKSRLNKCWPFNFSAAGFFHTRTTHTQAYKSNHTLTGAMCVETRMW